MTLTRQTSLHPMRGPAMRLAALASIAAAPAETLLAHPRESPPPRPTVGRVVAAPVRQPDVAGAAIDRAARAFQRARTVRASFDQTLSNPVTGTEARASGELVMAQPNRVSVRFAQPSGDLVVSDGQWLWVYLPSAAPNQVVKLPARGKGITGVDALGDMLTSPRSKYTVSDAGAATVGGRATRAVRLMPKAESSPIARATVWVDDADGAVRQLEMTDANGLVRTLRMNSWTVNSKVPDETFRFTVPEGARVVTQPGVSGRR